MGAGGVAPERLLSHCWEPGHLSLGFWNMLDSSRPEVCGCCLLSGTLFPALARKGFSSFTPRLKLPVLRDVFPVPPGR